MDLTRRTLEGEFGTTTKGSTPQADSSIIIGEDSSRKRRLSHISVDGSIASVSITRKLSAFTPGSSGKSFGGVPPSPAPVDALVRENSRLKFELDTAKSLQIVLEKNIRTLRDQLISQKSVYLVPDKDTEKNPVKDVFEFEPPPKEQNSEDLASLKAIIEQKESEITSLKIDFGDQISSLKRSLSQAKDQETMISSENNALRTKIQEIQDACTACQEECRSLKEAFAQQENANLQQNMKPLASELELHQNDLEIRLLQEKLQRVEAESAAELLSMTQKVEEAQSKIRCLEQLTQEQDRNHLDLVTAQDEIQSWRSLFSYIEKDITPKVLLRYLREVENKLSELEKLKPTSQDDQEMSAETKMKILENNVSSLEEENLLLRKKLKEEAPSNLNADQEKRYIEKIDNLTEEVTMLKEKLGSGHFNSETTKVLHMRKNPFLDQRVESLQAQITCLDAENKTLRSRLESLDAGSEAGITAQTELRMAQMQGENTLLQKKLTEVQKGSERLKQVFTRQIAMLRVSIPKIFGYQLEMVSDPNSKDTKAIFTLHPQGFNSCSNVVFKLLYDGSISLVENDFTKKYAKEIESFIHKFSSIPGFIANMTLENFQKQEN